VQRAPLIEHVVPLNAVPVSPQCLSASVVALKAVHWLAAQLAGVYTSYA